MSNYVDLSRNRLPVLTFVLPNRAVVRVLPPTVDLQEELAENKEQLVQLLSSEEHGVEAMYDLAARLLNRNRNLKKFTAESLKKKYGVDEIELVQFFTAYANFISEIRSAKN